MNRHIDPNDSRCTDAAVEILRRHDNDEPEANITSAVRDFLIATRLAKSTEIVEENPPSQQSRRAVDLTALDTFIEVKRRIGTTSSGEPDPDYIRQIDDYLEASEQDGKGVRMGILTDGRRWFLRWRGAGTARTTYPYSFTLESGDRWIPLFEWLRDKALVAVQDIRPDRQAIEQHFGPGSPSYERDVSSLKALYNQNAGNETIKIKRQLWYDLLRTALGESAENARELDDLFVRHTYLTAVIGMVVQASFGIDIHQMAETEPEDLLYGRKFRDTTGLQGIVESDFFAWPAEVGGLQLVRAIAHRVSRFDWGSDDAPTDIAAILYESIIPPDERRELGEYYTPAWLAKVMVQELVTEPLEQSVLDPACGSGTFIAEAVAHFITAAKLSGIPPSEMFNRLRLAVTGIDVHPVAVHLARSAYVLAARTAIEATTETFVSVPIYLGDALQLRFRPGDMFAEHDVTIQVDDEQNTTLVFPISLVERADTFDALMGDIAEHVERGDDPKLALDDHHISDAAERQTLKATITTMQRLHAEGRNHIWAYYTRNMVRPVALARSKVDVVIGNPPWLSYRNTTNILRTALESQSQNIYGIWAGGRYTARQDIAGLFFARSVDLYLREGGVIGMVMPHSALQAGQHSKWRTGAWRTTQGTRTLSVNFRFKRAWDLERLQPNTFFPMPASVVFAQSLGLAGKAIPLAGDAERWVGATGSDDVRRVTEDITDTSAVSISLYSDYTRKGADIYPRCLFLVNETENTALMRAGTGKTVTVNPRRGSQDKAPWKDLDLSEITAQTIETVHIFDIHLGETLVPYATLNPLRAVLPFNRGEYELPVNKDGVGGIRLGGLEYLMRRRWQLASRLWDQKKKPVNKLNLLENIDHYGKLSTQLQWQKDTGDRPVRVAYTRSGEPTAALLYDNEAIIDTTLYWITCRNIDEAYYLLAIINSKVLVDAVNPLTTPNWSGRTRDLHKHLWKLPIAEYDAGNATHNDISEAGKVVAQEAVCCLARLREERDASSKTFSVAVARAGLRKWLHSSKEGLAVENLVRKMLGGSISSGEAGSGRP